MDSKQKTADGTIRSDHWKSGGCTHVLALETTFAADGRAGHGIVRYYRYGSGFRQQTASREINPGDGLGGAVLVKAAIGDLITVKDGFSCGRATNVARVAGDGSLAWLEAIPIRDIIPALSTECEIGAPRPDLDVHDKDLEFLYSRQSPGWLRSILDRQLEIWWRQHAWHYFHYCGKDQEQDRLFRGTKAAPEWMLGRFVERLSAAQYDFCLRRVRCPSVFLPVSRRTPTRREQALREFPLEILTYAADRWSAEDLAVCATHLPDLALSSRHYLPLEKQDGILAGAVYALTGKGVGTVSQLTSELRSHVSPSIKREPDLWLGVYDYNWETFFGLIFALEPPSARTEILDRLINHLDVEKRPGMMAFLASSL